MMKIGVDIGGVIITRGSDEDDTSFFGDNYLRTPAVEDALETLRTLADAGWCIHLVSKCGANVERKTRDWLAHHRFYERTRIPEPHVHFCKGRADKAAICTSLGLTHFVDDRLEVLSYLHDVPQRYLFAGDPEEIAAFASALPYVTKMEDWKAVAEATEKGRCDAPR